MTMGKEGEAGCRMVCFGKDLLQMSPGHWLGWDMSRSRDVNESPILLLSGCSDLYNNRV